MCKRFLFATFVSLLCSCAHENTDVATVQMDGKIHGANEIRSVVQSVRTIPLEATDDASLIGSSDKICRSRAGSFVILDRRIRKQVYAFDSTGRFMNLIGRCGRGPSEYTVPYDIAVRGDSVFVLDHFMRRLLLYTIAGRYLSEVKMDIPVTEVALLGSSRFIGVNGDSSSSRTKGYDLSLFDEDGRFLQGLSRHSYTMNYTAHFCLSTFDGGAVYHKSLRPEIEYYNLDGKLSGKTALVFDGSMLPSDFERQSKGDFNTLLRMYPLRGYSYFTGDYWRTPKYEGLVTSSKGQSLLSVRNLGTGEVKPFLAGYSFSGLSPDGRPLLDKDSYVVWALSRPVAVAGETVYCLIDASAPGMPVRPSALPANPSLVQIDFK